MIVATLKSAVDDNHHFSAAFSRHGNSQALPNGYPHTPNHAQNQESHLPDSSTSDFFWSTSTTTLTIPCCCCCGGVCGAGDPGGGCGRGSGGGRGRRRQSARRQEPQGPGRRSCLPARSGPRPGDTTATDSGRRAERQAISAVCTRQEVVLVAATGGGCRRRSGDQRSVRVCCQAAPTSTPAQGRKRAVSAA